MGPPPNLFFQMLQLEGTIGPKEIQARCFQMKGSADDEKHRQKLRQ